VPGVTCYISQVRKGGWGQPLGLNEDRSNFSVTCRQMGPVTVDLKSLPDWEEAHREDQHLLQEDAHLPHPGSQAACAGLSRHQLADHRRVAGKCDQRRADQAVAVGVGARRTMRTFGCVCGQTLFFENVAWTAPTDAPMLGAVRSW
jgi:hypothetical protein